MGYLSLNPEMHKFVAALQHYQCRLEKHHDQHRKHVEAVREGIKRHRELERDEKWKVRHCRLCPRCRRVVEKIDGCDSMLCGQNYHGGNQQSGCGANFNWEEALPYGEQMNESQPNIPTAPEELQRSPCLDGMVRGRHVYHPFVSCAVCGSSGIEGLRFRCIHCKQFDACLSCESMLAERHDSDHIFEVMYEADFDWTRVRFPSGMPVCIVRNRDQLPSCNRRDLNASLEAMAGKVLTYVPLIQGSVEHRCQLA